MKVWKLTYKIMLLWDAMLEAASCGGCGCILTIRMVILMQVSMVFSIFVTCQAGPSSWCKACGIDGLCIGLFFLGFLS